MLLGHRTKTSPLFRIAVRREFTLASSSCKSVNITVHYRKLLAKRRHLIIFQAIDIIITLLGESSESNLCGSISSLWCREFERKLNLYDKIANPRYLKKIS